MISKQGDNLLFLLGVPRSGTTLLSVMLDGHSALRCPPEPWLMLALESVGRISARSAADAPVLYRAFKDFCTPDTAIVAARNYATVAYNQSLKSSGKKILVDKTPRYYLILNYLMEVFPRAKFVILWRNPLDIAASMRTTWQVDVASLLAAGEDHLTCIDLVVGLRRLLDFSKANADRVHTLQYERLVRQPQKTFHAVLDWLGLPLEKVSDFELTGGEYDHGEIGDKKILSTRSPHRNSIGRWKHTFNEREIESLVQSVGPHLFSAMGYEEVLANSISRDSAHSNAYAQRLESSLFKRNAEYDAVETFSDFTNRERQLHRALLGTTPAPGQPVAMDLATELREASNSAEHLAEALSKQESRINELQLEAAGALAKLEEARNVARVQLDHATLRETHWMEKVGEQDDQIQTHLRQLDEAKERIDRSAEELFRSNQQIDSLGEKLAVAHKAVSSLRPKTQNRRPWPYAIPEAPALTATLPGGKAWPRISVVTPSFNQGVYLEQTILSVLGQNYPDVEYLLIDGGSTDQTKSIIDQYRDQIDYVVSKKDDGQSSAINKGFARATGELLIWINSDDMLEPDALAAMAMAFATSGADMVAGMCTLHTDGAVTGRHLTSCADGPLPMEDLLDLEHHWLKGQFFYQPEVVFTRDLWQRAGGCLDEKLYYSMDYDLWLRFAEQQARLHVIGRPIARYRVHNQQKTYRVEDYRPELTEVRDRFAKRVSKRSSSNGHINGSSVLPRTHLRVLFFNDLGSAGGAGIAHQRLAASFAMAGHEAIPVAIRPDLTRCLFPNQSILQAIADRTPDLVFLGNIHSAQLDPAIIGLIAARWPTLQVLHDLYSLTGRCAYTGDCTRFATGCDEACPTAEEYPALELAGISHAWKTKHELMVSENPPILAAVSNWTQRFAQERFGPAAAETPSPRILSQRRPNIVNIRYGLPTDIFKPRDRSTCRDILNLPQDRFIILFSSSQLEDERKGLQHLIAALESLRLPNLLAVCIGQSQVELKSEGFEIRSMGYVQDTHSLAMLYSAADLFGGPSLVETFGQVFIEAAACGTPSVGYADAGGVADAVADGISGLLAQEQTPHALAAIIVKLYESPDLRRDMGVWGRLWVENEFSYRSAYQRIFAQLAQIGLIQKLHLAPKVSFYHDQIAPLDVAYLDLPAPVPGVADLLLDAQRRLIDLERLQNTFETETENTIAGLQAELSALNIRYQTVTTYLQDRDLTVAHNSSQLLTMSAEREALQAEQTALLAEREVLRLSIARITQTRLWRMVGAVYPIYQRTIGNPSIPAFARRPAQSMQRWLAQREEPDE